MRRSRLSIATCVALSFTDRQRMKQLYKEL